MNNDDLILRQQRLLMRSAQLRLILEKQTQVFRAPLAVAYQARNALQWLNRNPQWPLGALLVLLILRPRRTLIWSGRLWWAWRTYKRARNWMSKLPQQQQSR